MNGASAPMLDVFGEVGRHARFAVGARALALDTSVEIEAVVEMA